MLPKKTTDARLHPEPAMHPEAPSAPTATPPSPRRATNKGALSSGWVAGGREPLAL